MADLTRQIGTTSLIIEVFLHTSAFAGITGLTSGSAGLTCYYKRNTAGSSTVISLFPGTLGIWGSGSFVEVDSTHMPGVYEIGVPNAALASGADSVTIMLQGYATLVPCVFVIDLSAQTTLSNGVAHGGATATLELGGGDATYGSLYLHNNSGGSGLYCSGFTAITAQGVGIGSIGINALGDVTAGQGGAGIFCEGLSGISIYGSQADINLIGSQSISGYLTGIASPTFAGMGVEAGLADIPITAPTGPATNVEQMIVQLWRRFFKMAMATNAELTTYADNNSTVLTTQAISSVSGTDTVGPAS